jgi:hypothetical protein
MEAATSLLNLQRLHELMAQLGIEGASALPGDTDSGVDERNAWIRSACERILRQLAARTLSSQSDAARKLEGLVPVVAGLEHLSLDDFVHLDAVAERAKTAARAIVQNLPVRLQAKCLTSVASVTPTAADLVALTTGQRLERLQRRLSADIDGAVRVVAREIQQTVVNLLIEAVESLYPLACAGDDVMRATGHGVSHGTDRFASVSLVERLSTRRDAWRRAAASLSAASDASTESELDAGVLAHALGVAGTTAALTALRVADLRAVSPSAAFKTSVLDMVQELVWREWELKCRHILESVDQYVDRAFAGLKRQVDEWFTEVQHRSSLLCGRPANAEQQAEAARFEILHILRQAGGPAQQEVPA